MKIKTIKNIPQIEGKRIILRVDFNVPVDKSGKIQDDNRIIQALPTINYLIEKKARLIIITHMGRPKGEVQAHLRLNKVAERLSELLEKPVQKCDEVLSNHIKQDIAEMQPGEIIMLENIRFRKEEKECNAQFTKEIASLADIFVSDAFATAHRNHCSTAGLANHLPAYGGLLMEKEINALSPLVKSQPEKPLTMIFGGAKIDTKIGVIKNFLDKADYFLIGGALANTFLAAKDINVGDSLCEKDKIELAKEIIQECEKRGKELLLPTDCIVAKEISEKAKAQTISVNEVSDEMKILDIGPETTETFIEAIKKSKTIIWNGPVGLYEYKQFESGSFELAKAIEESDSTSIIGGGDTVDALKKAKVELNAFTHISTGGGACIEFLEGKNLPGIKILKPLAY